MVAKTTTSSSSKKCRRPSLDKPAIIAKSSSPFRHSLRFCRRILLCIFAHFALLPPPAPKTITLPVAAATAKKTLILDLDETLVHSRTAPAPQNYDFIIYPSINGEIVPFYVLKRPGCDELLKIASQNFEIIIFTAGLREYASLVLDSLDPNGDVISQRLYRDSCKEIGGRFVKDLSGIGRDLNRVVIVDDNPGSYLLQPENGVPVKAFVSDLRDGELGRVMEFLDVAAQFDDMRDAVRFFLIDERTSWICI